MTRRSTSDLPTSQRRSRVRPILAALIGLGGSVWGLIGCQFATPFRGPGYDRKAGVTLPDAHSTVVVVMTHAQLNTTGKSAFFAATDRVSKSMHIHPGLVGHSIRTTILGKDAWTMTVWIDHASADEFAASPEHKAAVRDGMPALRGAKFHRFEWPTDQVPPPWHEGLRRLDTQGESHGLPSATKG